MDLSLFPRDLFGELDRLQRDLQQAYALSPSIRGAARGRFPALNVASTPHSAEIYAFAPGLDPASIELQLERGVLSISGEREAKTSGESAEGTLHVHERFSGRFHRVLSLTDDLDPSQVQATYRDGVLHVSIQRQQAAKPRRININ
jgi:HSP20 family protein